MASKGTRGRKRKTVREWVEEHPDDLEVRKKQKTGGCEVESLVCKYCACEFDVDKKPWDRLREHLGSARHSKQKERWHKRDKAKRQISLFESEVRQKQKEAEAETVIHDFVRALTFSAVSIHQGDGYIGKVFKKYCQAARTMPTRRQLEMKYLPEVYSQHKKFIISLLEGHKISIIVDESPDVVGRPTVNTLFVFYNSKKNQKQVLLVDTSFVKVPNSASLSVLLTQVLREYEKDWSDVAAISTDSAEYMGKLVRDVKKSFNPKIIHIKDVPHLIHVAISASLECQAMRDIRIVVIRFGAIFNHAHKLERLFRAICVDNGLTEEEVSKPPQVVTIRWFSFYNSAIVVRRMWPHLLTFLDHPDCGGAKASELQSLLPDDTTRQILFVKLVFLIESLAPIHELQKQLESSEPLLHCLFHSVNVRLQTEIASKSSTQLSLGPDTSIILGMLTSANVKQVKENMLTFNNTLADKWRNTCERNLLPDVCGPTGLWKRAIVLCPFLKQTQSQVFSDYISMFMIITEDESDLEPEFNTYLQEPAPENPEIGILDYWQAAAINYPKLSHVALELLCLPNGSVDAERSFSKLRKLQDSTRASMSEKTLSMEMTLYVNQDIEEHFIGL